MRNIPVISSNIWSLLTVDVDDVGVDLVPDGVQDELEIARGGAGESRLRLRRTTSHSEHSAEISPVLGIADPSTADRGDPVH